MTSMEPKTNSHWTALLTLRKRQEVALDAHFFLQSALI